MTVRPRVLLLEDQMILAFALRSELQAAGIEVVDTCRDVESALAAMTQAEIDVGILDINLGDGTTCEPVAARLLDSETPFFFVTGYGNAELLPKRFGHIECLSKPVTGMDVANMVHRLAMVG